MQKFLLLLVGINLALAGNAYAEIYKRVDPDGRVTYSNLKTKGATRLELDPDAHTSANDRPGASASKRTPTPASFPNVDQQTQKQRDDKRKAILQSELEAEKAALAQAKQAYAAGESKPEVYQKKNANGTTSTFRNVPKFAEKMQGLQADVDAHQNNVELLQKELDALH